MQVKFLFLCKINPRTNAMKLSKENCKKIIQFSKKVLSTAIKKGGSSIRDFKIFLAKMGIFKKNLKLSKEEI